MWRRRRAATPARWPCRRTWRPPGGVEAPMYRSVRGVLQRSSETPPFVSRGMTGRSTAAPPSMRRSMARTAARARDQLRPLAPGAVQRPSSIPAIDRPHARVPFSGDPPAMTRVDRDREVDVRRLLLFTLSLSGPGGLPAEPPATLRPGVAYHYVKSNLDGSDPWQVTTYVSSPRRLDVLKWGPGRGEVVEVTADLDAAGCVAQHLEQWNLRDGTMALSMWAELSDDGWTLSFHRAGVPPIALRGSGRPVHPYGFDMQSMNVSPRCLSQTSKPPVIGLNGVNPVPDATPPLIDYGAIRVLSLIH